RRALDPDAPRQLDSYERRRGVPSARARFAEGILADFLYPSSCQIAGDQPFCLGLSKLIPSTQREPALPESVADRFGGSAVVGCDCDAEESNIEPACAALHRSCPCLHALDGRAAGT